MKHDRMILKLVDGVELTGSVGFIIMLASLQFVTLTVGIIMLLWKGGFSETLTLPMLLSNKQSNLFNS